MSESKTCFVITPIADPPGYDAGHFDRVYKHIIEPACKQAGFEPLRADKNLETNVIVVDILKNILSADIALCDLSSLNPNVLFELGIRQAFDKPVTLIKDTDTRRIFDISGIRDIEYDRTLRIDTTLDVINKIATALKKTYEATDPVNSLVKLMSIAAATPTSSEEVSSDTALILSRIDGISERLTKLENMTDIRNATSLVPFPDSRMSYGRRPTTSIAKSLMGIEDLSLTGALNPIESAITKKINN